MKIFSITLFSMAMMTACGEPPKANQVLNTTANANGATPTAAVTKQTLMPADYPAHIEAMRGERGMQEEAKPVLKVIEPKAGSTVASSTVKVKLEISGDLKGYMPHKDPATQMGNHIHVILDNQPYEAYYEIGQPFELRNVSDGEHTIRVFPSRPWHESYKNEGAFQMVRFTVKNGGGDPGKPTTTANGNTMANANSAKPVEGKDMQTSTAGAVDAAKPLLTYSRPKAEYKGIESDPIMIDFWLSGAKLSADGGDFKIRATVDNDAPQMITSWKPLWLSGWTAGKHSIKLELLDKDGNVVDNGGYNTTTREIAVVK